MKLIYFVIIWVLLGATPMPSFAQQPIGITTRGKVVAPARGEEMPWMADVIKTVPPAYPYQDRARYHQGSGLFRVTLDSKSGSVTNVTVRKSIGYSTLDGAVIRALRQWRAKPGKWKLFDFPVTYVMGRNRQDTLRKFRRQHAIKPKGTFLSD